MGQISDNEFSASSIGERALRCVIVYYKKQLSENPGNDMLVPFTYADHLKEHGFQLRQDFSRNCYDVKKPQGWKSSQQSYISVKTGCIKRKVVYTSYDGEIQIESWVIRKIGSRTGGTFGSRTLIWTARPQETPLKKSFEINYDGNQTGYDDQK